MAEDSRTSRFQRWYRDPERELLWREIAWLRQWCRRFPGNLLIVTYILFLLASVVGGQIVLRFYGMNPYAPNSQASGDAWLTGFIYSALVSVIGWVLIIISFGIWVFMLQRRTLSFLGPERLHDLLLTRLQQRNYWPDLLAAPVLLRVALGLMAAASGWISAIIMGPEQYEQMRGIMSGEGEFELFLFVIRWGLPPLQMALTITNYFAITLFVVYCLAGRRSSALQIVLLTILAYILIYAPGFLLQMLTMFISMMQFGMSSAGTGPSSSLMSLFFYSSVLVVPLIALLTALIMIRVCYGLLKHPGFMELLRKRAGFV